MWNEEFDAGETKKNYERTIKRLESVANIHPTDRADIIRLVNHLLATRAKSNSLFYSRLVIKILRRVFDASLCSRYDVDP
jgi:hypothetical protein